MRHLLSQLKHCGPLGGPFLAVCLLCGLPSAAGAQDNKPKSSKPSARPGDTKGVDAKKLGASKTSSTAQSEDSLDRPEFGPGSLISEADASPPRPPTALQVEADNFDEEIEVMERELNYFRAGADTHADDLKELIRLEFSAQREQLAGQYDQAIDEMERGERQRRWEAIARFEEFVRRYPSDTDYTPDAMFRLAELYFEKASDDYLQRSQQYEQELVAFERGERANEPEAPEPRYDRTIGLHKDLLERFPGYRLADAARYLLGYCYGEQNQPERSLEVYIALVENHPESRFLPEVWTRIGEIYFDGNERSSLEKALHAYGKVRSFPDSPYYDKALYKIAWTYYRLDRFSEAVASFIDLVNYADERKRVTGVSGSELRSEAIQYVAISLADEEWGGLRRAKKILNPLSDKEYAGELWKRYGEILFDQTRYAQAIEVLRYTIKKHPTAPHNPEAQEKIVRGYEQLRDFDGATRAREVLVRDYSEGSKWYKANEDNRPVIANAQKLTERSLYTAAIFRHQQAQAHKAANRIPEAKHSYVAAAGAYEQYLERFPGSKNAYDFEFFLAECLYYSGSYQRAATQYDKVRDSTVDNKHLEAAALSSVITYEKLVEQMEKSGRVPKIRMRTAAQRKGKAIRPRKIAAARKRLIDASDRFLRLLPRSERAPAVAYRAGEVYYKHDQFEEARRRFQEVVAKYPSTEVAQYASNLIIESYLAAQDWDNVEKWSQKLIEIAEAGEDGKGGAQFISNLKGFRVGAQFKQAEKFDSEGNYEAAADTYVRLVDENAEHEFADKALFNAALAYEKVKRFDTASGIYKRIYEQYPKSELAPRALFREGINAEKGFVFPAAIAAYTRLVNRYPDSSHRADAMYNVAVVLEHKQEYKEAAQAFKRYAQAFPKREDAGQIFFRAALVYEKMKDWKAMVSTLNAFIKQYNRAFSQRERIVEAHKKIGDAYLKRGNERRALKAYGTCLNTFRKRKLRVESRAGAHAGQCAFEIAEAKFRTYDNAKIKGSSRQQVRALTKKARMQRNVEKAYTSVFQYKRVETTLAASYRIGHSYERFAEALFSAPIPKEFRGRDEYESEYKAQLEDKAAVLERKAEGAYRKAYDEAKRTRVTNLWTRRILEGLNKYSPQEFPVQKSGRALMQTFTISGHGLDNLRPAPNPDKPGAFQEGQGERRTATSGE